MSDLLPLAEEARAAAARARLSGSLGALQARLAPKSLAESALQGVVDKGKATAQAGVDIVKKHPAAVLGTVAALGLLIAQKPLARLFARQSIKAPIPKSSNAHTRAVRRNAE